jgi:ubiquinone/menaquinone biosynthesis C-methylase UbiE
MPATSAANDEQVKLWNSTGAHAWIELQEMLDRMFEPLADLLAEVASTAGVRRVLDIGCGTGGTTLAIARRLGADGCCVGVDISEPLLAAARRRVAQESAPAKFIRADAQTYEFEPAGFDALVSRFGVMFFDDPVKAFANLGRAARAGAELRFVAWRSAAENPFMTTAERAAAAYLPNIPPRVPDAPGQFAFADQHRVNSILEKAGWVDVDVKPIDVACTVEEKHLVPYFTKMGPLGRILPQAEEATRRQVIQTVRAAFESYVHGAEVRFTAACWLVRTRMRRD